jgi:hypothetical protein
MLVSSDEAAVYVSSLDIDASMSIASRALGTGIRFRIGTLFFNSMNEDIYRSTLVHGVLHLLHCFLLPESAGMVLSCGTTIYTPNFCKPPCLTY